jgi:hypothetical protein
MNILANELLEQQRAECTLVNDDVLGIDPRCHYPTLGDYSRFCVSGVLSGPFTKAVRNLILRAELLGVEPEVVTGQWE